MIQNKVNNGSSNSNNPEGVDISENLFKRIALQDLFAETENDKTKDNSSASRDDKADYLKSSLMKSSDKENTNTIIYEQDENELLKLQDESTSEDFQTTNIRNVFDSESDSN